MAFCGMRGEELRATLAAGCDLPDQFLTHSQLLHDRPLDLISKVLPGWFSRAKGDRKNLAAFTGDFPADVIRGGLQGTELASHRVKVSALH